MYFTCNGTLKYLLFFPFYFKENDYVMPLLSRRVYKYSVINKRTKFFKNY